MGETKTKNRLTNMEISYKVRAISFFVYIALPAIAHGNVFTLDLAPLTTQRLDPIVFKYENPAGHVHSIFGGSKFSKTSDYLEVLSSNCTTGNIIDDLSVYWVPSLYVKKANGAGFHHVEARMAVYYKLINDRGQTNQPGNSNPITPGEFAAFPPEFRMLAGNMSETHPQHHINHKCYGPYTNTPGFPDNPVDCIGGIRAEVTFPSCWDGHSPDSQNHQSPMAYPRPKGGWEAGKCPPSHPVRVPTLFFEAIYQTQTVVESGDELVYSFKDYSGFGFHGDFVMGWKEGTLEQLIDYCTYHDGLSAGDHVQCNAAAIAGKHGGPNFSCSWEGHDDLTPYVGLLDDLPPCGRACKP